MESRDTSEARYQEHAGQPVDQTEETTAPDQGGGSGSDAEGDAPQQGETSGEQASPEPGGGEEEAEDKARESINKAFE